MVEWILYIMISCGSGCVEVTARKYNSNMECLRNQIVAANVIAWCKKEEIF